MAKIVKAKKPKDKIDSKLEKEAEAVYGRTRWEYLKSEGFVFDPERGEAVHNG